LRHDAAQDAAGYYPPALTGLRGNHPGSFETAHALRDAAFWSHAGAIATTGKDYDDGRAADALRSLVRR
jgi:spermidine dehydrogenase